MACLTFLTSSQGILIQVSKSAGKFDYPVTTANCMVELTKCLISLATLAKQWSTIGVNDDNRLQTTLQEVWVFPIPAFLYLIKNLMQYFIFLYVDAPSYQVLKNLNIISTGVLYRIFMQKELSAIQWTALVLLTMGCTTSQLSSSSDEVLSTPFMGVVLAIVMALLSGAAGVYTELIIKKRPQRSINVQNFCARPVPWGFVAALTLPPRPLTPPPLQTCTSLGFSSTSSRSSRMSTTRFSRRGSSTGTRGSRG